MTCGYCKEAGHKRQTCHQRKVDDVMWKIQQQMKKDDKKLIFELAKETILHIHTLAAEHLLDLEKRTKKKLVIDFE